MGLLSDVLSRPGSWWISSKSDPRWNESGRVETVSILSMPKEVKNAKRRLSRRLGAAPADLEWGVMKD
ncbi:hypothetical protein [Burkholderia ubonensis]|uniref:hypothetical protein n=1 Tax=Burkholderia ubonensis TaxID=101571 RepID=UPI000AC2EC47|nr:hypothetical protein [Burkholderia ubonensis]